MRTFKIYSLNNFQICNTIFLTIVPVLYITFPGLIYFITAFFFFAFFFLRSHPQHVEAPRLGVKSELQLTAYTTAIAEWDPSCLQSTPQLVVTLDP